VVRSLSGALGGISGGKLYISGVAGLFTPIWDVLALQGERVGAGEHIYGAKLINFFPIRQAVPVGLAWGRFCSWARWARFFTVKNAYYSRYSLFTYITLFSVAQGRGEWMDGSG